MRDIRDKVVGDNIKLRKKNAKLAANNAKLRMQLKSAKLTAYRRGLTINAARKRRDDAQGMCAFLQRENRKKDAEILRLIMENGARR